MNAALGDRKPAMRSGAIMAALFAGLLVSACQSGPTGELTTIDTAQGSDQNISSLTAVISRNPGDPEAYNVRGSAYGRGGKYREALKDFDKAIELKPSFYQAYANRAPPISAAAISTAKPAACRMHSTISRRRSSSIRPMPAPTTIAA
jgi:tetratricopeptide (TPR) repeat protein